jgi:hypothetical protein
MQTECKLDDVWDVFAGRALALLIFERLGGTACGQETLFEMILADDAEMFCGDRLGMLAHRRQQLGDAGTVDLLNTEELSQRVVRTADFFEYFALNGSPGKSAELGDEFSHCTMAPEIAIPGYVGGEISL